MIQPDKIQDMYIDLRNNLMGFIGASIVDMSTGMSLAASSDRPDFDLDVAAAYNCEMVKAKLKTMQALGLESRLIDMLLTLEDQLHLIRMLDDNLFVYVAVSSAQTNLAMLRASVNSTLRKYEVA